LRATLTCSSRQPQAPVTGGVHDGEPGDAGEQREPCQEHGQQQQRRAEHAEHVAEVATDHGTENAAGVERQNRPRLVVQTRQTTACGEGQHEADGTR
jgi:hypothetical protein